LSNRYIIWILESIRIRLFEHWPKRNCSPGAQLFWLVLTADDRRQRIGQFVVDDSEIASQLGGDEPVRITGPLIP
jgi:hypothetical protein